MFKMLAPRRACLGDACTCRSITCNIDIGIERNLPSIEISDLPPLRQSVHIRKCNSITNPLEANMFSICSATCHIIHGYDTGPMSFPGSSLGRTRCYGACRVKRRQVK